MIVWTWKQCHLSMCYESGRNVRKRTQGDKQWQWSESWQQYYWSVLQGLSWWSDDAFSYSICMYSTSRNVRGICSIQEVANHHCDVTLWTRSQRANAMVGTQFVARQRLTKHTECASCEQSLRCQVYRVFHRSSANLVTQLLCVRQWHLQADAQAVSCCANT